MMLRLIDYYGHDVFIDPSRVLFVSDGGCGSRGVSAVVHLDTGKSVSVLGWAADIAKQIEKAKRP